MEVILKFVSPDLSEIGGVESYDPFGASRLIWILCRNFKIQVATLGPSLNHELTVLIGDFSKICRDISGAQDWGGSEGSNDFRRCTGKRNHC